MHETTAAGFHVPAQVATTQEKKESNIMYRLINTDTNETVLNADTKEALNAWIESYGEIGAIYQAFSIRKIGEPIEIKRQIRRI